MPEFTRPAPADGVAWPLVLAATAVLGSLATACLMPFVAVAVATAASMSRRAAAATIVAAWAVNQILGFGLLGFPRDAHTISWGLALGGASLVAMMPAARILAGRGGCAAKLAVAFLAAFAGYEGALLLFASVAGGIENFIPAIVLRIFANDLAWFVGLMALHAILSRTAPRIFGAGLFLRAA